MPKFQSYNTQSKRWTLFKDGKIAGSQKSKYPGVRVKKGKPGGSRSKSRPPVGKRNRFWLPWIGS